MVVCFSFFILRMAVHSVCVEEAMDVRGRVCGEEEDPGDEFHVQGVRLQVENVSRKSMSSENDTHKITPTVFDVTT